MNEQIIIKYKEEALLKDEMTEREKAIWYNGYKEGQADSLKRKENIPFILFVMALAIYFIVEFIKVKSNF